MPIFSLIRLATLTLCLLSACAPSQAAEAPHPLVKALVMEAFRKASPSQSMHLVQRSGTHLTVGSQKLALLGVNRYQLAGGPMAKLCQYSSSPQVWEQWAKDIISQTREMGGNVVRLWAFQGFAGPTGRDFSALDRLVDHAKFQGVRLILTLENQWADCTQGGIKDAAWYSNGYRGHYGYPLSFPEYLDAIVGHFKGEPAIAIWQVLNEGKLFEAPQTMRAFMVAMAQRIKKLDPGHLVSSGGALQCWQGAQGVADFKSYADDSAIDVLDGHDYGEETTPWTSCMDAALTAAKQLGKPLIIGEAGIHSAGKSTAQRSALFASKLKAAAQHGVAGYLLWSLNVRANYADDFDVAPDASLSSTLHQAKAHWFD
jgi:mannan endo-1,4-beta-mannosidase